MEPAVHTRENNHIEKLLCGICRRQFSMYTCPTCGVAYCSLTCFRAEPHSQCSETFYRKEVEADILSNPSKGQERLNMMKVLQRFEQSNGIDEEPPDEEEMDENTNLARRLAHINIQSASPDEIWSILAPDERAKFIKALDNPSGELAQQLLASEEIEHDMQEPWWESSSIEGSDLSPRLDAFPRQPTKQEVLDVPSSMVKRLSNGSPLIYNICATLIAYAYCIRYFGVSALSSLQYEGHELEDVTRLTHKLVPFLTDRRSKTLYLSLSDAITGVWSRFDSDKMTAPFFSLLLRDVSQFIRPLIITVISNSITDEPAAHTSDYLPLESHPSLTCVRALSDFSSLFSRSELEGVTKHSHVEHKLLFYAAQILSTPPFILNMMADNLSAESQRIQAEDNVDSLQSVDSSYGPVDTPAGRKKNLLRPTRVIELSGSVPESVKFIHLLTWWEAHNNRGELDKKDHAVDPLDWVKIEGCLTLAEVRGASFFTDLTVTALRRRYICCAAPPLDVIIFLPSADCIPVFYEIGPRTIQQDCSALYKVLGSC